MRCAQVELRGESHAPVFEGVRIKRTRSWLIIDHLSELGKARERSSFPVSAVRCVREWEEATD